MPHTISANRSTNRGSWKASHKEKPRDEAQLSRRAPGLGPSPGNPRPALGRRYPRGGPPAICGHALPPTYPRALSQQRPGAGALECQWGPCQATALPDRGPDAKALRKAWENLQGACKFGKRDGAQAGRGLHRARGRARAARARHTLSHTDDDMHPGSRPLSG